MKKNTFVMLMTLSFLLLYIGSDFLFSERLFYWSANFSKNLQKNDPSLSTKNFFKIMAQIGHAPAISAILAVLLIFTPNLLHTMTFFAYFAFSTYLISILKLSFSKPRPYWVNPEVIGIDCEFGFGHPSGHASMPLIFFFFLYKYFIFDKFQNLLIKIIGFALYIFLYSSIFFSRLFLGVHGLNQVLMGFFIGLALLISYYSFFKSEFENIFVKIDQNRIDVQKNRKNFIILLSLLIMFGFIIPLSIFAYIDSSLIIKEEWIVNINQNCVYKFSKGFQNKGLSGGALAITVFGFLIGITLKKPESKISSENNLKMFTNSNRFLKEIGRIFIVIVIALPGLSLFFIPNNNNPYVKYIVNLALLAIVESIILVTITPLALKKFGLNKKGDFSDFKQFINTNDKEKI